jgi:hypothetical protein
MLLCPLFDINTPSIHVWAFQDGAKGSIFDGSGVCESEEILRYTLGSCSDWHRIQTHVEALLPFFQHLRNRQA